MDEMTCYEIQIQGAFSQRWEEWFQGMTIRIDEHDGVLKTCLMGSVHDQSELMGILQTLANMNLTLLLVQRLEN
jgi:hypothetical protein